MRLEERTSKLRRMAWHKWFAWYPVCCGNTWVWLEYVERNYIGWFFVESFQYRILEESKND